MSRPRTAHKHLPRYVVVIHGAYWYRPPGQKATRVGDVGDDSALYTFLAKLPEPVGPITTMNQVFDKYCLEVLPALKPITQKLYFGCIKVLRPVFGPAAPDDIKPRDIGRFMAAGKAKIMRNRQLAVLSTVYAHAVKRWYVAERNPCSDVEKHEKNKRTRYISDEEFAVVRAMMPQRIKIAMDLAYLTGQRQKDILEWKWSDAADGFMRVEQSKTGKRLDVRVSDTLALVLAEAKALKPDLPRVYIVRQGKGKRAGQPYTGGGFRAIWQRIMKTYVEAGGERFTFHDIRAKAISDAKTLQAGFELSGHSNISLTLGTYQRKPLRVEATK